MSVRPLLKMLDRLTELAGVDEEPVGPPSEVNVVTCIDEDLQSHLKSIAAIVHLAGGVLLDISGGSVAIEGDIDTALKARIEAAVELRNAAGALEHVVISASGGQIHCTIGGTASTNPGHRNLLGLCEALFSRDLRESTLGVICLDESGMDPETKQRTWDVITQHLENLQLGSLRTLVILVSVSTGLDVNRHCRPPRSARLIIETDRWHERRPWDQTLNDVRLIAEDDTLLVLFCAAGFSASSQLPLGDTLRNRAIRGVVDDHGSPGADLPSLFYEWCVTNRRILSSDPPKPQFVSHLTLERVLLEERRIAQTALTPTLRYFADELHPRALANIGRSVHRLCDLTKLRRIVIVTVNFDELIESVCGSSVAAFSTDAEFKKAPKYVRKYLKGQVDEVPLLKLHGTISKPESIIATSDTTMAGLTDDKAQCLRLLCTKGKQHPVRWVYVGASMRDYDIGLTLNDRYFVDRIEEHWVSPVLPPSVHDFCQGLRTQRWADLRRSSVWERTIHELADEFLEALVTLTPPP